MSVFPFQFFSSSQTENNIMLKLGRGNVYYIFFAFEILNGYFFNVYFGLYFIFILFQ